MRKVYLGELKGVVIIEVYKRNVNLVKFIKEAQYKRHNRLVFGLKSKNPPRKWWNFRDIWSLCNTHKSFMNT